MKMMKKPHLDGGGPVLPGADSFQDSLRKATHFKEGGEVEGTEDHDEEIHNAVGEELMSAIHSKDHKKLMSGLEAMVLNCMNKKED